MRLIISAILGIFSLLVGLRFLLLLFGVSPDINIVSWIFSISTPLVAPFTGWLPGPIVLTRGISTSSVLDWSSLLAFLVFGFISSLIGRTYHGTVHHA